jgi:hypothetical protein
MGVLVLCYWVVTVLTALLACTPFSFFWNPKQPGHCFNRTVSRISLSIINVITDFAIVIMPMPVVWNLQLPTARKIGLSGIFLLGGIVTLASIMRFPSLHNVDSYDFSCRTDLINL